MRNSDRLWSWRGLIWALLLAGAVILGSLESVPEPCHAKGICKGRCFDQHDCFWPCVCVSEDGSVTNQSCKEMVHVRSR